MSGPDAVRLRPGRRATRFALFLLIVAAQFAMFEAGLRWWGSSEAAPAFQGLFETDPTVGYRLAPNARVRFTTSEFDTRIHTNAAGLRDEEEVGPKPPGERRILLLGDSIVLSVQVAFDQTFGELLEADLNRGSRGTRYRVLNAGVQGYGPVEEALLFRRIGPAVAPDLVLVVVFVGNDAEEAYTSRGRLEPPGAAPASALSTSMTARLRRLVRRSMVLQIVRLRVMSAADRFAAFAPPEPPIQSYARNPAPRIHEGLAVARRSAQMILEESARLGARTAFVLMPARFQVDDEDFGRMRDSVRDAGGELLRDAATERFDDALSTLPAPRTDLLPAFRRRLPGPDLFFQTTVHLTPWGHRVTADALSEFLRAEGLVAPGGAAGGR